ncbi:conserved hypothetical protein [Sphingomonas sp. EC-HK361]|uniref:pilus assembly protein TadG-related protein n=1 Tax=Sphingomonas sp. EC-HK361 TaxID=2038397 RepID=UPI0012535A45|nr:pilus assembly protein TadG-related protein [Sphingomonas sp. EC-HK361]VVT16796.1 conserved hypothetical protein [Sphingomonas sp. EC-HK361]
MRHLLRDRRAGVGIMVAAGLPLLLGCTAFAVDIGSIQLETRRLQGIADAAALSAAADPGQADQGARAVVAAAAWPRAVQVATTAGSYSGSLSIAPAARFTPVASGGDAARVTLTSASPTFFASIFGVRNVTIVRTATAARERAASFSVGSRLAALDGGLLNGMLSGLTGSTVSLSVMDYNALAGADVDLFGFLDALRTTAHVEAGSYDDLLATNVTTAQALAAVAAQLDSTNNASAAAAIRKLANGLTGQQLSLGKLIDAGPLGGRASGGGGIANIDAMALVTALLEGASPTRQLSLDIGASIPGLASTSVKLAIGERPNQSPWIAITNLGTPIVRTAQTRLYIETKVAPALGLVGLDLPIFIELAGAEARLSAIDCGAPRGVTVEARPDPGTAAIAAIDEAKLDDFKTPMPLSRARLARLLLVDVTAKSVIDLGSAATWQPLRFSQDQIDARAVQTVSGDRLTASLTQSLLTDIDIRVGGLSIGPLVSTVGSVLSLVAPALDQVIGLATGALGVHVGQADVRVTGLRCGTPVLVA